MHALSLSFSLYRAVEMWCLDCLWTFEPGTQSRGVDLPGNRLGTSLMAGRPVPRLEERGVVEWTEGDAMGLR